MNRISYIANFVLAGIVLCLAILHMNLRFVVSKFPDQIEDAKLVALQEGIGLGRGQAAAGQFLMENLSRAIANGSIHRLPLTITNDNVTLSNCFFVGLAQDASLVFRGTSPTVINSYLYFKPAAPLEK